MSQRKTVPPQGVPVDVARWAHCPTEDQSAHDDVDAAPHTEDRAGNAIGQDQHAAAKGVGRRMQEGKCKDSRDELQHNRPRAERNRSERALAGEFLDRAPNGVEQECAAGRPVAAHRSRGKGEAGSTPRGQQAPRNSDMPRTLGRDCAVALHCAPRGRVEAPNASRVHGCRFEADPIARPRHGSDRYRANQQLTQSPNSLDHRAETRVVVSSGAGFEPATFGL
jgi:hypothetical protein